MRGGLREGMAKMPLKTRWWRWAGLWSISIAVVISLILFSSWSPVWATPVTPTAALTPDPVLIPLAQPSVGSPVVKVVIEVEINVTPEISANAEAVVEGKTVEVRPEKLKAETDPVTKVSIIELPAVVAEGKKLEGFSDPDSGVKMEANVVTIPIKDAEGKTILTFQAKVKDVVGTGTSAKATVVDIKLKATEQKADLTEAKPEVGEVTVFFDVGLKEIPKAASIKIEISDAPTADVDKSINLAATGSGTTITDVAYVMIVTKGNLPQDIQSTATVTMKVPKKWADDRGGSAKVRLIRPRARK